MQQAPDHGEDRGGSVGVADSPAAAEGRNGGISYQPLGSSRGGGGPGGGFTGGGSQGGQQHVGQGGRGYPNRFGLTSVDDDHSMSSPTHSQQLGVTSAFATRSIAIRHAYGDSFMN